MTLMTTYTGPEPDWMKQIKKRSLMDFSKVGLVDGLKKVGNVAIYIIASMAVIGLGMFVANTAISWAEVRTAMLVGGSEPCNRVPAKVA